VHSKGGGGEEAVCACTGAARESAGCKGAPMLVAKMHVCWKCKCADSKRQDAGKLHTVRMHAHA